MQMASLMALVNDRVTSLESKVAQQHETIMHLEYKLDTVQGKASRMPYLSGRFGYGLGRPAVRREVLLFAKRAQHKRERDDFTTVFLGKHRTDFAGARGSARARRRSTGLHGTGGACCADLLLSYAASCLHMWPATVEAAQPCSSRSSQQKARWACLHEWLVMREQGLAGRLAACSLRCRQARADRGAREHCNHPWPLRYLCVAARGQHVCPRQPVHLAARRQARAL